MPDFSILRQSDIEETFRTRFVKDSFDYVSDKTQHAVKGSIDLPEKWRVGLIVGSSGTGKSMIAQKLFGITSATFTHASVIDDFPDLPTEEIVRMMTLVGFGSVPSWLKPFSVLSMGEQARVHLAYALLSGQMVYDEFTSVVDRHVARMMCTAVNKVMAKVDAQIVLVSCHFDILDWLKADWVFSTDTMTMVQKKSPSRNTKWKYSGFHDSIRQSGESLSRTTI